MDPPSWANKRDRPCKCHLCGEPGWFPGNKKASNVAQAVCVECRPSADSAEFFMRAPPKDDTPNLSALGPKDAEPIEHGNLEEGVEYLQCKCIACPTTGFFRLKHDCKSLPGAGVFCQDCAPRVGGHRVMVATPAEAAAGRERNEAALRETTARIAEENAEARRKLRLQLEAKLRRQDRLNTYHDKLAVHLMKRPQDGEHLTGNLGKSTTRTNPAWDMAMMCLCNKGILEELAKYDPKVWVLCFFLLGALGTRFGDAVALNPTAVLAARRVRKFIEKTRPGELEIRGFGPSNLPVMYNDNGTEYLYLRPYGGFAKTFDDDENGEFSGPADGRPVGERFSLLGAEGYEGEGDDDDDDDVSNTRLAKALACKGDMVGVMVNSGVHRKGLAVVAVPFKHKDGRKDVFELQMNKRMMVPLWLALWKPKDLGALNAFNNAGDIKRIVATESTGTAACTYVKNFRAVYSKPLQMMSQWIVANGFDKLSLEQFGAVLDAMRYFVDPITAFRGDVANDTQLEKLGADLTGAVETMEGTLEDFKEEGEEGEEGESMENLVARLVAGGLGDDALDKKSCKTGRRKRRGKKRPRALGGLLADLSRMSDPDAADTFTWNPALATPVPPGG
mmetsp:Transcript_6821/g.21505  ORF Transcript_6821/g.21505 Transcript_6821/m.21505 type:complete len:618 (+) Transcript_6821:252-2105(+)